MDFDWRSPKIIIPAIGVILISAMIISNAAAQSEELVYAKQAALECYKEGKELEYASAARGIVECRDRVKQ